MKNIFTTWQDVHSKLKGRKIAIWGAGNIADKTIRRLPTTPDIIFDNSENIQGTTVNGLTVNAPDASAKNYFIIITTTSFREVSKQLLELGLPEDQFIVSPVLNDLRIIDELEAIQCDLIVASGGAPATDDHSKSGGGIYHIAVRGTEARIDKKFNGSFHSLIEVDDAYFAVDDIRGFVKFDREFNILKTWPGIKSARGHGLSYDPERQHFFMACSYLDKVLELDQEFTVVREFLLSIKADKGTGPHHHTNDCLVIGDSLYVSMFSETGNWKRDIFDGAVIEFDIDSGEKVGTPIKDLWMPHSILFIDGSLTILDSLRGGLLKNNASVVGQFPGFMRGLDYDGQFYFIGQSKNRNFSKSIGISKNISIDNGIIIFDEVSKVSRTIHLSGQISEIHSVKKLQ